MRPQPVQPETNVSPKIRVGARRCERDRRKGRPGRPDDRSQIEGGRSLLPPDRALFEIGIRRGLSACQGCVSRRKSDPRAAATSDVMPVSPWAAENAHRGAVTYPQ